MFLRGVLKRWNERPARATEDDDVATACRVAPSLLEELATDPEDFADLAALLHLDLAAVRAALVRERLQTPIDLLERLAASIPMNARPADAPAVHDSSWGGGGTVGWRRWTRAHGGARVQRDSPAPTVRPAMAPS